MNTGLQRKERALPILILLPDRAGTVSSRAIGTSAFIMGGRNFKKLSRQVDQYLEVLDQWFSIFLMLRPFNTVPHVMVTLNHKIYFYCCFITVILLLL